MKTFYGRKWLFLFLENDTQKAQTKTNKQKALIDQCYPLHVKGNEVKTIEGVPSSLNHVLF